MNLPLFDWLGLGVFVATVLAYSWAVERSPYAKHTLSRAMARTRRHWFHRCAGRDLRMVDGQIMAMQQNGAAYFGSAALLGIGAGFTVFTTADSLTGLAPFANSEGLAVKALLLMLVYAASFFQFSWAYRLFAYNAVALGAIAQQQGPKAQEEARRAAALNVLAGQYFNRAIRLFLFAIPLIFWLVSLWGLLLASFALTLIMLRRQFFTVAQLDGLALSWQIEEERRAASKAAKTKEADHGL